MITYSTQFPVKEELDKKTFVEVVLDWNQGSKYDKFDNLDWDGKTFSKQWIENDKQLSIEELEHKEIVAAQLKKEDEHGLWKTDLILNYGKKYITIRVALETTDFTTCNQRAQTDGFAEQNGRDAERADLTCRY